MRRIENNRKKKNRIETSLNFQTAEDSLLAQINFAKSPKQIVFTLSSVHYIGVLLYTLEVLNKNPEPQPEAQFVARADAVINTKISGVPLSL